MLNVPPNRIVLFLGFAVTGTWWDLYSKSHVFAELGYPRGQGPWWIGGDSWMKFRLYTSMNEGALWGVGQGFAWLFAGLSLVAIAGIIYWLFVRGAAQSIWLTVALGLIMSGTIGNLYDRVGLHGCVNPETGQTWFAVRDFLLFTFGGWPWPVFNFADVFLVTGAGMLILQSLFAPAEIQSTGSAEESTEVSAAA